MISREDARKAACKYAKRERCVVGGTTYEIDGCWVFMTYSGKPGASCANYPLVLVEKDRGDLRAVRLPSEEGFRVYHQMRPVEGKE